VILHTASEVISFSKRLENESAKLYKDLSQIYTEDTDVFLSFAKENEKNKVQTERAYYGVITNAIEGCFAFNIESDDYTFETDIAENRSYSDALEKTIEMEEKIIKFYSDAAEQSESLMADVPRNFVTVADKRTSRIPKLRSLAEKRVR